MQPRSSWWTYHRASSQSLQRLQWPAPCIPCNASCYSFPAPLTTRFYLVFRSTGGVSYCGEGQYTKTWDNARNIAQYNSVLGRSMDALPGRRLHGSSAVNISWYIYIYNPRREVDCAWLVELTFQAEFSEAYIMGVGGSDPPENM